MMALTSRDPLDCKVKLIRVIFDLSSVGNKIFSKSWNI
jgi:hypothetical protein